MNCLENMELILWRHAEAEDGSPDHERPLTERGQKQAKRMAEWLSSRIPLHSNIFVSPALRTKQTAQALCKDFAITPEIGVGASVKATLNAVNWGKSNQLTIVVGHQPTLGQVAAYLLCGKEYNWSIKKGAIWWIEQRPESNEIVLRACMTPNLL